MQGKCIMEILILSCSTGGGHNSAGRAMKEELEKRGHHVDMRDLYSLSSEKLADGVGNTYVKLVQKTPKVFGFVYMLGEMVRKLPFFSPVYRVNGRMEKPMSRFLEEKHYDAVLMPHLFPAEIFTYMKEHGSEVPKTVFIATDYTCIPFTEETSCDYYVVPGEGLASDFAEKGIPKEKILPFGIPVRNAFLTKETKEKLKEKLGLDQEKRYVLISGGSMGAGDIITIVKNLCDEAGKDSEFVFLVLCGNNQKLFRKMERKFRKKDQVVPMKSTSRMAEYMKACDGIFTKPGGLSSTEAAVVGIPLFHITPIPGCETINMRYFCKNGLSLKCKKDRKSVGRCLRFLDKPEAVEKMLSNQKRVILGNAASDIADFVENMVKESDAY